MRIGTKLIVAHLCVLAVLFGLLSYGLPNLVRHLVVLSTRQELTRQAHRLADEMLQRPRSIPALTSFVERFVANASMLVKDESGVIVLSSDRALMRRKLPTPVRYQRWFDGDTMVVDLPDSGRSLAVFVPLFEGFSLVMVRPLHELAEFAHPIARGLLALLALAIGLAVLTSLLVSRGMVQRLKETGAAARSLAEGDLASRAPATGADEIADLGGHFNHMADRLQALVEGLRKSERLRRDLLINVSHELRTPMTSIQGFAEALRDGVVTDEDRRNRYYRIIAQEAGRLSRLTTDLFDVARLEAGQLELRLQSMAATPWLASVAEQARHMAEPQGARVDLTLEPGVEGSHLYGDSDRLSQVMTNLIHNAVRYSPENGTVTIGARLTGNEIEISVRDQGPGIPPEERDRVFERFFQGKIKSARGHKGAGLGLAIVRSIVEAHGGSVGVESTGGQGARFWFRLAAVN